MADLAGAKRTTSKPALAAEALGVGLIMLIWLAVTMASPRLNFIHPSLPLALQASFVWASIVAGMRATYGASGGHLNPLISLTSWLCGQKTAGRTAHYIFAQIAGGMLVAIVLWGGVHRPFDGGIDQPRIIGEWLSALVLTLSLYATRNTTIQTAALTVATISAVIYVLSGGMTFANPVATMASGLVQLNLTPFETSKLVTAQLLGLATGYGLGVTVWGR